MSEQWLMVGKIVNTHGIRGELKIYPNTDFPEVRFAPGNKLQMINEETGASQQVEVQTSRLQKNMYVIRFKGFGNINEVEQYKGWVLKVSKNDTVDLEEDEYYFHEIIGCEVVTDEGQSLGVITEILTPGANDVWVVKPAKGKDILIPYIHDVVLDINVEDKKITIHVMEGLLE
ncbi:ribosome maturation factor RimM [Paenibacillus bovis]|uniref:Ribosome maturation factor RimM n=1 Tax=Paenibacillus bovis TaxID=1616788 RepID=A0A172ZFQ2_9BACL|nr:ribosome maturation factor RimM [Paenibacillus bovis]ANF96494.1 ribosome maturation factor RimM [Paenibacillus bovis]